MALIKFNDECAISRVMLDEFGKARYNEFDEPMIEWIYRGECSYQVGGESNSAIIVRNDVVYLPNNDSLIYSGDMIEIATKSGRNLTGIVGNVRDIEMPLSGELYTKFEIKRAMGE